MRSAGLCLLLLMIMLVGCGSPETIIVVTPTPSAQQVTTPTATLTPVAATLEQTSAPTKPSPTMSARPAVTNVQSNADWQPVVEIFDEIEMVYVPPGCFQMGSVDDFANEDEKPSHGQCIETPFWIDRTEITNAQFGSIGNFRGPDLPRDNVTLPQAQTYCASRGGRLPTEAEWEYAARGLDSLRYPWGNTFEEGHAAYSLNAGNQSRAVGSYSAGASWVGALDMSGNLWEWTSTIYAYRYPYQADDGRENLDDVSNFRAIRGGAYSTDPFFLRTSSRKQKHPTLEYLAYVGFRCVLPVD